jgi:phage gp29-like protein
MLAFWDGFGEMFGMPVRIGKTSSRDPKETAKIEDMLSGLGAAAWGLFPEGTAVEFVESSRGDAFNVYDRRIDRANSEMAKCILGQTMTIDNGASLSQSQVHYKVFQNIVDSDADFIRDLVNNKLLPFMQKHGIAVEDYTFEWDEAVEYTPQEMQSIEQMLLANGYDIPPQYFIDRYNIQIDGRTAPAPMSMKAAQAQWWENADFFVDGRSR